MTLHRFYLSLSLFLVALYAMTAFYGWEFGATTQHNLPPEVRQSNSIRSFHFWHDGYQGGK